MRLSVISKQLLYQVISPIMMRLCLEALAALFAAERGRVCRPVWELLWVHQTRLSRHSLLLALVPQLQRMQAALQSWSRWQAC